MHGEVGYEIAEAVNSGSLTVIGRRDDEDDPQVPLEEILRQADAPVMLVRDGDATGEPVDELVASVGSRLAIRV